MKTMSNKFNPAQIVALLLVLGFGVFPSRRVVAAPVTWSVNGHEYEFVSAASISWTDARAAVPAGWYLATLTTAAENQWVYDNVVAPNTTKEAWLGASAPASRPTPPAGWTWVTGEAWAYTDWAPGEPNNSSGLETGLAINRYGTSAWNDEGCCLEFVAGYVIEGSPFPDAPPIITKTPLTQTAETGTTPRFRVELTNTPPQAFYQWCFQATNALAGATNAFLELTNVQIAQSGAYTVVVTNVFGAVTSSPAMLSVIPPVERRIIPAIGLNGSAGVSLEVDCADSQSPPYNWSPLGTLGMTGTSQYYFDISTPLPTQRSYRARLMGGRLPPVLGISLAEALTLTGLLGSNIRMDGINQIGPTDAWFTLATVTLTNTSQLYIDSSSIGQPQRLYRLVQVP